MAGRARDPAETVEGRGVRAPVLVFTFRRFPPGLFTFTLMLLYRGEFTLTGRYPGLGRE